MTDDLNVEFSELVRKATEAGQAQRAAPAPVILVPPPSQPLRLARQFVDEKYADDRHHKLASHRGRFYAWSDTHWRELSDRIVHAKLYGWLEDAVYEDKTLADVTLKEFNPTPQKISNITGALGAAVIVDDDVEAPCWLAGERNPDAVDVVALRNGLLHVPTRKLAGHTPAFYNEWTLPFDFDPEAKVPKRWESFLRELWDDDDESIATLQEIFGYAISGDTSQQKMFLLVGPKRGGKGTIGRVLTSLLGRQNVAGPTLSSLATNFGLAPLLSKPLAIVSDARLGGRADKQIVVERLLSISGEDSLTVDVKYRPAWTGKLPTRFLVLTNELPRLTDSSGALASRFVMLILKQSFYGREDPNLGRELMADASGIFNWALEGLDRLTERGYFEQPSSSREAVRHLEDLSSPVGAFTRDRCTVGAGFQVVKDDLWQAWKDWCLDEGRASPGTKAIFMRDLLAAVPGAKVKRLGGDGARQQVVVGLALNGGIQCEVPLTTPDVSDGNRGRGSRTPDATPDAPDVNLPKPTAHVRGRGSRQGSSGVFSTVSPEKPEISVPPTQPPDPDSIPTFEELAELYDADGNPRA